MSNWVLIDRIKKGIVEYKVGDVVVLFRKKGKHPRGIEFNKEYFIWNIENDVLVLTTSRDNIISKVYPTDHKAIHKTYMIQPWYLRDFRIERLLLY
jgi:hypothetical protein